MKVLRLFNRRLFPGVARASFFKGTAGSTQSKQWRIEWLYRYKQAKTSRITVLNIQKLYLYFVYFKLYVYFAYFKLYLYFAYFNYIFTLFTLNYMFTLFTLNCMFTLSGAARQAL